METVFEKPLNGEIGNLTNLTTTAKTDLVSAVNEVKGSVSSKLEASRVAYMGTVTSSAPMTLNVSNSTRGMVIIGSSTDSLCAIYFVVCASTGTVSIGKMFDNGSRYSFTTDQSNKTVLSSNTSSTGYVECISFQGMICKASS